MSSILKFFLENGRLNYVLMLFITFLGIFSYMNMPKDVFPPIKLDKIIISGGYAGSSVNILDKMAVTKLEDELRSITGVDKMESTIKNSKFTITLTMSRSANMQEALNDAKDVISNVKRYFPSDMDEPIAKVATINIPILAVVISSETETIDDLIKIGKEIKTEITKISGVSNVNLYAENDKVIEINLDSKKVEVFNLDKQALIAELQKFSYIYPAGKIEETGNHLFISTFNGQRSLDEILNIKLSVSGKIVYLKDIANVTKKYKENDIITRFNGKTNVEMGVFKNESGDAIELTEIVKKRISELNQEYKTIKIDSYNDASKIVRNRLNTVVSSIIVGILLVGLTVLILINSRVAFVVTLGIPTAILIGAFMIYMFGYAINIMTLLGVLLILGVLVDDALIVAENIQRHIKSGEDKLHSALVGTKEVLVPVLASSLTTLFAFSPMFVLTGEMGEFMKMIPVAIIALVIASLLESFVFLPLHAYHSLNKNTKELSWKPVSDFYKNILRRVVRRRIIYIPLFWVGIPLVTVLLFSTVKYQLFPDFDSSKMFVRGTFNINHTVDEVSEKVKPIETKLLELQKKLEIKSISLLVGYQNSTLGGAEIKPNVFEFFIELHEKKPDNFLDKYVNPIFSPKYDASDKTRELDVTKIVSEVKENIEKMNINGLEELLIIRDKPAIAKYDIEIQLNTADEKKLVESLDYLKTEISKINGIITYGDDAKEGIKELKLKPNPYGESLGFTEGYLAQSLSPFFLEVEQGRGLGNEGIVEVITKEKHLNSLELLQNFQIKTPDGSKYVQLSEVAEFIVLSNFEMIYKENGSSVKTVFANVNNEVITAVEVLEKIAPAIHEVEQRGVSVALKGEQEQNERMKKELGLALLIAIFLIFITLLTMFNSFRSTFIILSVIPFSILGAVLGHIIMDMNFAMPSVIGILGLAGVVINNGVVMLDFIRKTHTFEELLERASLRLRPIIITSVTTFVGLSTLIFFASGQAVILQPIAVSLGFGLLWGTVLNLIYLPAFFVVLNKKQFEES